VRIDILTLFPEMFVGPLTESILKRALATGLVEICLHDIRDFSRGKHHQADDKPYGGGAGMVMMAEPIVECMEAVIQEGKKARKSKKSPWKIYLSPQGKRLRQSKVEQLARKYDWLLLLCGHYEGVDQRVIDDYIDEEISIGDYVLTGGEIPAMVLVDAVARQIPGVLGKEASFEEESFSKALGRKREYPHYTRPEVFRGKSVPSILLSGNHRQIEEWRRKQLR
jgi:tRNA (guanine37-N1)-methyltransferase